MRCLKTVLGTVVLGMAGSLAEGQSVNTLIKAGDAIVGIGAMRVVPYIAIADSQLWVARIGTDSPDGDRDFVVLRNGFVTLREGMTLFNPAGAKLDDWTSLAVNANADLAMAVTLKMPPNMNNPDGFTTPGLLFNLTPLAIKDQIINAAGLGPNSDWDKFESVKVNARNEVFFLGEINNTAVGGGDSKEDVLARIRVDSRGNILETTILATKDQTVPVLGSKVAGLGGTEHILDVNDQGDFITYVGAAAVQGVVKNSVLINMDTIVAQERQPIPGLADTQWQGLVAAKVSINNKREYIVTGNSRNTIDNTNAFLIVKNGEKFAQLGDIIPTISPSPMIANGLSPVVITDPGDVFWVVRFNTTDDAFARNYEPIIQRNVTTVNGNLVIGIIADENCLAVSRNGRFFAGRVDIQSVGFAIAFVDFGLIKENVGCAGRNPATLKVTSGKPLVGQSMVLSLDNGQRPGVTPFLAFATQPARSDGCGFVVPWGEVLISPAHIRATRVLAPWDGINPAETTLNVPNDLALVDAVFYAQGAFRDPSLPPRREFRLTNALEFRLGPP